MIQPFHAANAEYEAWLRLQCDVVGADLKFKHKRMKKNAFVFLRATYFRWARRIPEICPDLMDAPVALSVADTHVENFGTWRDVEGRLVWGINDFDEAADTPYPLDLVRLAASVRLSAGMTVANAAAAAAILEGYRDGLKTPRPILLDEQETWMRPHVACSDEDRQKFWSEARAYPTARPPARVVLDLTESAPPGASVVRFASRVVGGGSLGRPRYVMIARWRGGEILREAKALVPSAWNWARGRSAEPSRFLDLANGAYRSPDPFLAIRDRFILRRIAADSRKVNLDEDAAAALSVPLLTVMGFDLGAIHAASPDMAPRIAKDLASRPKGWLNTAAKSMAAAVKEDYAEWTG
jgi:hypothetical protein